MINWFKKKQHNTNKLVLKKPKLTIKIARDIRDAKIKINKDEYFDLFMQPQKVFELFYKDALLVLSVYKIMLQDQRTQQEFDKDFNEIDGYHKISDIIFEAWLNFFPLPLSSRQRLKLLMKVQKKIQQKEKIEQKILGKRFIK